MRISKWAYLDTVSKVKGFLKENNIKTRQQLKKTYSSLFRYCEKHDGWLISIFGTKKVTKWSSYNTVEDFNRFIKENKITSSNDFQRRFSGLYDKSYR